MNTAQAVTGVASLISGPLTVVDVGAQTLDGEHHVYQPLYQCGVPVRVIGFEPITDRAAARRVAEQGRRTEILEACVGDGQEAVFHANNSSGTSSLFPLDAGVCSRFVSLAGLRTLSRASIQTTTLDELLADEPSIDFLKLDIQGAELAALEGAGSVLARTALCQCETEFAPIYQGQPLFSEIETYMRRCGFDFLDFHRPAYRAPVVPSRRVRNDQLLWADAIFASRPGVASDRQLLAQAIMAAVLYGKLSIAERALAEYDARHGTRVSHLIATLG